MKMKKCIQLITAIVTLMGAAYKFKPKPVAPPPPPPPPVDTTPPKRTRMIDVSNFWLSGVTSDVDAVRYMTAAKATGYDGVVALAYWPSLTHQQMWAAREAGMFSDMYVFPDWKGGADQSIPVGRVKASWEAPCWVWIDQIGRASCRERVYVLV